MDAQLKKIQIVPCRFDDAGEVKTVETATLTFAVPIDDKANLREVQELYRLLGKQWVRVAVEGKQVLMDLGEPAGGPRHVLDGLEGDAADTV